MTFSIENPEVIATPPPVWEKLVEMMDLCNINLFGLNFKFHL